MREREGKREREIGAFVILGCERFVPEKSIGIGRGGGRREKKKGLEFHRFSWVDFPRFFCQTEDDGNRT